MDENVDRVVSVLYEISTHIFPKEPEKLLFEFGEAVIGRLNFTYYEAEINDLKLKVKIPEDGECRYDISFSGEVLKVKLGGMSKIPDVYYKILDPLFRKLDYTIKFIIFLKKSPDIIIFLDEEGRVVEMNDAAMEILGDIRGEKLEDKCSGDVCEHNGRIYSLLTYSIGKGSVVVGRDITSKMELQREIEEKERRFKTLIEVIPVAILIHQDGEIVFVNDTSEEITGYSGEELIGMSVWKLIHPDYRELAKKMLEKRLGRERPVYQLKILRKDGKERWVLVSGSTMLWKGKKSVIAAALDITDKKILEDRLRESEELFRNIFFSSPVGQYILVNRKFELVNPAFENLTGYKSEELLGRESLEIVHPDDRSRIRDNAVKMLKSERIQPYLYRIVRKDGEIRWVYENVISVVYRGKRAVLGNVVDITDLEIKRKKLEELTKMLELINKTLRHDVLNALTTSLAYLEMYEEDKKEGLIEKVKAGIDRGVDVVRNMRAFEYAVKLDELRCINVREIVEKVVENFDIPVEITGHGEALADEGLRSVIENIVQNAVIHSGTDRIVITIKEEGKSCEIRIADYGKGIPDSIKEKIFEEGFKYGETGKTGLGMFIASKIVERYGGKIWVEDNHPSGSVFVIMLNRC